MERIQINNGVVFSPFYVFIKGVGKLTDKNLLESFGIKNAEIVSDRTGINKSTSLFITEDSKWIHLMDYWDYSLYHNEIENGYIQKLSEGFDIFTCSVGDSDKSFEFKYFVDGQLIREYMVEGPNYKGGRVARNYGTKLISEESALLNEDELDKVVEIAKGIGIEFEHSKEKIRHYKYIDKYN